MRALVSCLLATGLVIAMPATGPGGVAVVMAQSAASTEGVRVIGAASTRVNVRAEPQVQPNNVVDTARGGDRFRVLETRQVGDHVWYRLETLPAAAESFTGWIRGDLIEPEPLPQPTLPEVLATPAPVAPDVVEQAPPPSEKQPEPPPLSQRTDWSRNLIALYPAIEGCARVSSAPPVTVLRALGRSRGLAEVMLSDSTGRRWDCLIRDSGGTPIRYDPLSGAVYMSDRMGDEPFFSIGTTKPPLDPACFRFEQVTDPASGDPLGWLYYRTCS